MSLRIVLALLFSALSFYIIVKLYKNRITWPQARYLAMTSSMYRLLYIIYVSIFLGSIFEITENLFLSISLMFSIFINLSWFIFIFLLIGVLYYQISQRERFKPERFSDLILRPLGFPEKTGSSRKSVHVERDWELKSMSSIRYLGVSTPPRYPRGNSCSLGVWSRQRSNCKGFE